MLQSTNTPVEDVQAKSEPVDCLNMHNAGKNIYKQIYYILFLCILIKVIDSHCIYNYNLFVIS